MAIIKLTEEIQMNEKCSELLWRFELSILYKYIYIYIYNLCRLMNES